MVPGSRRRFLTLCASSVAAAVAGCSFDDGSTASERPEGPSFPDPENVIVDPPMYTTRVEATLDRDGSLLSYGSDGSDRRRRLPYVMSDADAEAVRFRRKPADHEELRDFLRETDYDSKSVLTEDLEVSACYRYALQYVELEPDGDVSLRFCRVFRDPSVARAVDERHRQLVLVRVPITGENPPSGYGRGMGHSCRLPPGHPAAHGGDDE
jgi:hypothetical protein